MGAPIRVAHCAGARQTRLRGNIGLLGTILLGIIGSIIGAMVVLLLLRVTGLDRGRSRRRI